jgi:methionyl-tRNA synthetase
MWQAMLMSAGLPNSTKILINGFINVEGQKMSKSLGNVISPMDMVSKYQTEPTRYLLISLGTFSEDIDVSWDKFDEKYTADLANGIGNLCSRVAKMADTQNLSYEPKTVNLNPDYQQLMNDYELTAALDWIIDQVKQGDQFLSDTKPWKQEGEAKNHTLTKAIDRIRTIAHHLQPFMPDTAKQILDHFQGGITQIQPMFPRLDS